MKSLKFRKSIHSKEHIALRNFWKTKREALGLSQRAFARKYNFDYSLISKIERGDRRLDSIETVEYCKMLNIKPSEIVDFILKQLNQ